MVHRPIIQNGFFFKNERVPQNHFWCFIAQLCMSIMYATWFIRCTAQLFIAGCYDHFLFHLIWEAWRPRVSTISGLLQFSITHHVHIQDANDLVPALKPLTQKEQLDVIWNLSPPEVAQFACRSSLLIHPHCADILYFSIARCLLQ